MAEIEIGLGKAGRQAYGFDDIAIVPSRRTRDPEDTDIAWEIDAFRFDLPIMSAAMDTVTSPATAVALGQMGGVGVLHLEGLWTRYEDPEACFAEIAGADPEKPPPACRSCTRRRCSPSSSPPGCGRSAPPGS